MAWIPEEKFTALEWFQGRETLVVWIGGFSLGILIISAVTVPVIVRRLPSDYFLRKSARDASDGHPLLRLPFLFIRNFVGGLLVTGGIIMLVTPGQGLLTAVVGLLLMDFPGKRRLEICLIRFGPLNRAINWIRRRDNQPPLELPESSSKNPS